MAGGDANCKLMDARSEVKWHSRLPMKFAARIAGNDQQEALMQLVDSPLLYRTRQLTDCGC